MNAENPLDSDFGGLDRITNPAKPDSISNGVLGVPDERSVDATLKRAMHDGLLMLLGGTNEASQLLARRGRYLPFQSDIRECTLAYQWKSRIRPKKGRCYFNSQRFAKENMRHEISYWSGVAYDPSRRFLFLHA